MSKEQDSVMASNVKYTRIALFVDSANMHHACKRIGYFIDWRKVMRYFTDLESEKYQNVDVKGFFYYAVPPNIEVERLKFLDFLSHNGYVVKTKALKTIRDSDSGQDYQKANLSMDIAVDMLLTSDHWDIAYIFSGDGDLERVVTALRARGKAVYAVTTEKMMARELAYVIDKPVMLLESLEHEIGRIDRKPEDNREREDEVLVTATPKED